MIVNSTLRTILQTSADFSTVVEIYGSDATPDDFSDPASALKRFAAGSINFAGETYERKLTRIGGIKRTVTPEANTASIELSNVDRSISAYELSEGFEGKIMVIRLISRANDDVTESMIMFVGRCEKPAGGNKETLRVSATWILGGTEVQIPRRKYTREDQEGRVETDPEFEGFIFIPQYGTTTYSVRVKRGGLLGLLGFKKTVHKTIAYSSYSDLDSNKVVPEVLGTSQLEGTHIAYDDVGTNIRVRTAFSEGPIDDIVNARSIDSRMPLSGTNYEETMGLVGAANLIGASWVGPGNYSRTACIVGQCTNSAVEEVEPAPDIVAVIRGRLMTIPDGGGAWTVTGEYSNNAAAHTWWIITSDDVFKLDSDWLHAASFTEVFNFNAELIIMRSSNDFNFLVEG